MYIWNGIRKFFQEKIEEMGIEETNFPMFLSSKSLEKVSDLSLKHPVQSENHHSQRSSLLEPDSLLQ